MADDSSDLDHEVTAPRAATTREWEAFVRTGEAEPDVEPAPPLTHVGSVSAPTRDAAVEQATRLFAGAASTLWLCPADEVSRYTASDRALANRHGNADASATEPSATEPSATETSETETFETGAPENDLATR